MSRFSMTLSRAFTIILIHPEANDQHNNRHYQCWKYIPKTYPSIFLSQIPSLFNIFVCFFDSMFSFWLHVLLIISKNIQHYSFLSVYRPALQYFWSMILTWSQYFLEESKAKGLAGFIALAFLFVFVIISIIHPTTGDTGDSITHYLFSKYAWSEKGYMFNLWAKPVFTFFSSPFSQFGMDGNQNIQ